MKRIAVVCLLLVNAIALFPLLTTGFAGDDILNSQIRGGMIQSDRSLWDVTSLNMVDWLRNQGRLFPLAFYIYTVFYVLSNPILYKLAVLAVVLAGIAMFFKFVWRLSGSAALAVTATLLLPIMIQFRGGYDPVLAFCGQYPLMSLLLFGSFNLFLRFLDEGDRRALWLSTILFLCASLIFEIAYLMFLIHLAIAYLRLGNTWKAARAAAPLIAVACCLGAASAILRAHAVALSPTYTVDLVVPAAMKSYLVQIVGAIPYSYFAFDPHAVFSRAESRWPASVAQAIPLITGLVVFTLIELNRQISKFPPAWYPAVNGRLAAIGALLLAIPPCLISLSPKFRAQSWGDAYLPVYISYFGTSLLLAIFLQYLYRRFTEWGFTKQRLFRTAGFAFLLCFVFAVRNNWLVAAAVNESIWNARVLTEEAIRHDLLSGVAADSVLIVSGDEPWNNVWEYSGMLGKRLAVYRLNEPGNFVPVFLQAGASCGAPMAGCQVCEFAFDAPVYTLQIRHLTAGTGAVLLSRVRRAFLTGSSIGGLAAHEVTAFFRFPAAAEPLKAAISGRGISEDAGDFRVSEDSLRVIREGRGWKVASLSRNTMFDVLSVRGEITVEPKLSSFAMPKTPDQFELRPAGSEILHVGFQSNVGSGIELHPIAFDTHMSIEVLVAPRSAQVAWADIVSNHGLDPHGFAIEQLDRQTNRYRVVFGSGKGWMDVGAFDLISGRRNYISIQVEGREARLYVNGAKVARTTLPEPIAPSSRPLRIGNWINGDRPFAGSIEELMIARGAKPEEAVLADAKRLMQLMQSAN